MSTAELTSYTADDLLRMPEGDQFELVGGQLVEIDMGGRSGWIGGQIYANLNGYSDRGNHGWAFPADVGIQCFPDEPQKVRRPDTCFVCRGRFENEEVPIGFLRLAPDVVAEVISPNELYYAVDHKVQEYLDAGIRLVWVINPKSRTATVYRAGGGNPSRLGVQDELSGEDVLPGFRCPIVNLFPATGASSSRE
jgi:Uma2 family endonuclease